MGKAIWNAHIKIVTVVQKLVNMNVTNNCSFDSVVLLWIFFHPLEHFARRKSFRLVVMAMNTRKRLPSPPNQDAGKERGGCGDEVNSVKQLERLRVSRSKTE